ncbi:hypothetical protein Tco_1118316, partial [Tanacetum coccineum]
VNYIAIMKTKAARYEIKGIEDMVPTLWSPTKVGSQLKKFSKHNVYSTKKILRVKSVSVKKLYVYGHLEEIVVKRANHQFYKFKEGGFMDLHLNDIEDMLLLAKSRHQETCQGSTAWCRELPKETQHHSTSTDLSTNRIQRTLHSISQTTRVIYKDLTKQKRVMRADELYKFSDGTLKKVRDELHHRVRDFGLEYNKEMPRKKWMTIDRKRLKLMVELIDKQMHERRIIRNLERLVGVENLRWTIN